MKPAALINEERIERILRAADERGDSCLLETDGFEIVRSLGFTTCPSRLFRDAKEVREADWEVLSGDRVVIKIVSEKIVHKSDVGGVAVVANDRETIALQAEAMESRLSSYSPAGFTINQFVEYDASLGGELLFGLRRTDDFGPVVTIGCGGIYSEFLAKNFKVGRDVAVISAQLTGIDTIAAVLDAVPIIRLLANPPRGQQPRIQLERLVDATGRLMWLGQHFGHLISEFEINPLVIANGELVALDVLVKVERETKCQNGVRPVEKLKHLLEPRSIAVIGVSEKLNPGHVIVNNLLREGFDRSRLYVIKQGTKSLEGCTCCADIASLPERVDLLVVSVAAAHIPQTIAEVIEKRKAESIVVIPGGLEEKSGSEQLTQRLHAALTEARSTDWRGPIINGGNCLGIRSRPGRIDTMFIPQHKLSSSASANIPSPLALISQSGAFALAKADKFAGINPKYNISLGNQMDLTVGDYLSYLKDDPELEVFVVYIEGFAKLDGLKFLKAAAEITARGKTVVLYRAGRTPAGAQASSSHTASIAGDYTIARALAKQVGVVVAESLEDFEDLTLLFNWSLDKHFSGCRLGAISNAGFECVAFADNPGKFSLPTFSERTVDKLNAVFKRCNIDKVVDAHNPLDLTPMANDASYEDAVLAVMEDDNVDIGIIGCVPMTPALNTLQRGEVHYEDIDRDDSVVQRLVRVSREIKKPVIAVIDAGSFYDPMTARLQMAGIPTFRTADRALRSLDVVCRKKARTPSIT